MWTCFRCGRHSVSEVIRGLLGCSWAEAYKLRSLYRGREEKAFSAGLEPARPGKSLALPVNTKPLSDRHQRYLKNRGFDPSSLLPLWDLQGTGPVGTYKLRIIAPVYHDNRLVSYIGRDITDRSAKKYLPCPAEKELRPHKQCLYGLDLVPRDSVVVVEGITDVWRLGPGAVATFGSKFTLAQVNILAQFKTCHVMYDADAEASADKLAGHLSVMGIDVDVLIPETDPAELPQEEADNLMISLT